MSALDGKVVFAGIDVGSLSAQAVLLEERRDTDRSKSSAGGKMSARSIHVTPNPVESARQVMGGLLDEVGLSWDDIDCCVSTGYGREKVQGEGMSSANVSEISCHGLGARALMPGVKTVIDIGGQDAKVIRIDDAGELADFVMNDKCAAGTGRFLEVMSRTLGIGFEELGQLALSARNRIELSSRCSIFAETEALHYLQRGADKREVAAGITRSMADRVAALARRVGVERDVVMTGGVAKNPAVKAELERILGVRLLAPPIDPQLIGAYGAAVLARRESSC